MKVKLSEIIDGVEMQSEDSTTLLHIKTGEIINYLHELRTVAEENPDLSEEDELYREDVLKVKEILKNQKDYISLPTMFDFNEFRVMERFITTVKDSIQREKLMQSIQGKGAFGKFRELTEKFSLTDDWDTYYGNAMEEFAKKWCSDNNLEFKN